MFKVVNKMKDRMPGTVWVHLLGLGHIRAKCKKLFQKKKAEIIQTNTHVFVFRACLDKDIKNIWKSIKTKGNFHQIEVTTAFS